jgi:hypothetical protein
MRELRSLVCLNFRTCAAMASDPTTAEGGSPIEIYDVTDEHQTMEVKFVFKNVSYSSVENVLHACRNLHSKNSVNASSAWYLSASARKLARCWELSFSHRYCCRDTNAWHEMVAWNCVCGVHSRFIGNRAVHSCSCSSACTEVIL